MGIDDVFGGLGHGLLSLVGVGFLNDPMGDLRGQLSSDMNNLNMMTAQKSEAFAESENEALKDLYTLLGVKSKSLQQTVSYNNELIWDTLKEENFFMAMLASIVIIIIFFMLIQKKCC